jgi:hypothetical protein
MALNLKGMNAGQLLNLRHQIDVALDGMKKELEAQLVQISSLSGPRIKRSTPTVRKKGPPRPKSGERSLGAPTGNAARYDRPDTVHCASSWRASFSSCLVGRVAHTAKD